MGHLQGWPVGGLTMTRKHKGRRQRTGTQGTSNSVRQSAVPEVEEISKAIHAALTHQTSTSNISEFAGAVVHGAYGHGSPGDDTTTKGRKRNWFMRWGKWNKEHPPLWGAWLLGLALAIAPYIMPPPAAAQPQIPPQTTQSQTVTFGLEVRTSVTPTGPPGPTPTGGSGPMPGSGSGTEYVDVNLDLSVLAEYLPAPPHTLSQKQLRVASDKIAVEIHNQLEQKLPGESVPIRVQVGEYVYNMPSPKDSQSTSQYISQYLASKQAEQS